MGESLTLNTQAACLPTPASQQALTCTQPPQMRRRDPGVLTFSGATVTHRQKCSSRPSVTCKDRGVTLNKKHTC